MTFSNKQKRSVRAQVKSTGARTDQKELTYRNPATVAALPAGGVGDAAVIEGEGAIVHLIVV